MECRNMDEMDIKIVKLLAEDGRISYREIARRLHISEPTARQRVKRLLEAGKVSIRASVNVDEFPEILIAFVGLKQSGPPEECLDALARIPEVVYTINTIGRYDIIAVVAVSSRERLADILTNDIFSGNNPAFNNITGSETHMVLYNRNLLLPADKIINTLEDLHNMHRGRNRNREK